MFLNRTAILSPFNRGLFSKTTLTMKEIIIPILAGIGGISAGLFLFFLAVYKVFKWSDEKPKNKL